MGSAHKSRILYPSAASSNSCRRLPRRCSSTLAGSNVQTSTTCLISGTLPREPPRSTFSSVSRPSILNASSNRSSTGYQKDKGRHHKSTRIAWFWALFQKLEASESSEPNTNRQVVAVVRLALVSQSLLCMRGKQRLVSSQTGACLLI